MTNVDLGWRLVEIVCILISATFDITGMIQAML